MSAGTIGQALHHPAIRRALNQLVGCPVGGWGETQQAIDQLRGELPRRDARNYTLSDLVDVALTVDHADTYRWRATVSP